MKLIKLKLKSFLVLNLFRHRYGGRGGGSYSRESGEIFGGGFNNGYNRPNVGYNGGYNRPNGGYNSGYSNGYNNNGGFGGGNSYGYNNGLGGLLGGVLG